MSRLAFNVARAGQILRHPYLTLVSRLGLGGTFVFSGVAKLVELEEFAELVAEYGILPHALSQAYGYSLPGLEVALGIFLVAGLFLRTNATISILILISFIIAKSVNLYRGDDISCGCFGTAETLSSVTIVLGIILLALAFQILFHRGEFLSLGPWLSQKAAEQDEQ